ncbi:MAG: hypothetical protein KDB57_12035 [Solirubrobacterales bacterium]|jgi:hypothetical protein|nr:hypothetical protein [Solirubrobacterales bacterium]
MWLVTDRGFYSVVDKGEPGGMLCVRSRVREDLESLCRLDSMESYSDSIRESDYSDYRFRIFVARGDWEKAASVLASEIDYDNFKNAVADRQGSARASIYSSVWSALRRLQSD